MLAFSDGLSFLTALLYKVWCFTINMKGESLGEGGEEKDLKKKKAVGLRKLCV